MIRRNIAIAVFSLLVVATYALWDRSRRTVYNDRDNNVLIVRQGAEGQGSNLSKSKAPEVIQQRMDVSIPNTMVNVSEGALPQKLSFLMQNQNEEDARFDALPRDKDLEDRFKSDMTEALMDIPYLSKSALPEMICRDHRCRLTGEFVSGSSVDNANVAMKKLKDALSGNSDRNKKFASYSNYYFSENGLSYFRSFLSPK